MPWKAISNENDKPLLEWQLEIMVRGFFNRELLLDYIRYFVLFENNDERLIKKIAGYHQFHAVREAVQATIVASTGKQLVLHSNIQPGSKKAGVVWHTQGSGKSISMCCYVGKLLQQEIGQPTIVVVICTIWTASFTVHFARHRNCSQMPVGRMTGTLRDRLQLAMLAALSLPPCSSRRKTPIDSQ
ncbi:MAG: hypothetical protein ACLRP3_13465 [Escherichia sp.]